MLGLSGSVDQKHRAPKSGIGTQEAIGIKQVARSEIPAPSRNHPGKLSIGEFALWQPC